MSHRTLLFNRFRFSLVNSVFDIDTQTAAAHYGVSVSTWQSYCSGRRNPPDDLVDHIEQDIIADFKKHIPALTLPS